MGHPDPAPAGRSSVLDGHSCPATQVGRRTRWAADAATLRTVVDDRVMSPRRRSAGRHLAGTGRRCRRERPVVEPVADLVLSHPGAPPTTHQADVVVHRGALPGPPHRRDQRVRPVVGHVQQVGPRIVVWVAGLLLGSEEPERRPQERGREVLSPDQASAAARGRRRGSRMASSSCSTSAAKGGDERGGHEWGSSFAGGGPDEESRRQHARPPRWWLPTSGRPTQTHIAPPGSPPGLSAHHVPGPARARHRRRLPAPPSSRPRYR